MKIWFGRRWWRMAVWSGFAVGMLGLAGGCWPLLSPDQRGLRLLQQGNHLLAADTFADPMWRGVALYRAGEFEQAAGVFAGYDTPESAFNQANALVMLGRYEAAVARYDRALELRPYWAAATDNREIAAGRAARLAQEGGEGTGGKLGADDVVMSDSKSPESGSPVETGGGEPLDDMQVRAQWLRKVQTDPADFLRAKFARQAARAGGKP